MAFEARSNRSMLELGDPDRVCPFQHQILSAEKLISTWPYSAYSWKIGESNRQSNVFTNHWQWPVLHHFVTDNRSNIAKLSSATEIQSIHKSISTGFQRCQPSVAPIFNINRRLAHRVPVFGARQEGAHLWQRSISRTIFVSMHLLVWRVLSHTPVAIRSMWG